MGCWNPCSRLFLPVFAKFNSFVHCRHEFTIIKSVSLSLLVFLFKAAVYLKKKQALKTPLFKKKQYITAVFGKPTHL